MTETAPSEHGMGLFGARTGHFARFEHGLGPFGAREAEKAPSEHRRGLFCARTRPQGLRRGLVLFLLLSGVLGQEFGLDVGGNLDVLGKLHLEGGTTTGEG